MIDTATKKPLKVSNEYPPRPYIRLPFDQLDEVRRILDKHQIGYWVREYTISLDGGPEKTVVYLNRGTDVAAVQMISTAFIDLKDFNGPGRQNTIAPRSRLADLNASHDYYVDTKFAWDIVGEDITAGRTFTIRNPVTGTETTHVGLLTKSQGYVAKELNEATFQQFISIFESYIHDLLHHWLTAYPQNLIAKKVDYKVILDSPDKEAITTHVVSREVNEIMYERPSGWFAYLEERAKIGCPEADEIERIAEAKASRDVLVHNRGVANRTYESKAGKFARYKDGQQIDIADPYHHQIWELLRKVVDDVSNAAIDKLP